MATNANKKRGIKPVVPRGLGAGGRRGIPPPRDITSAPTDIPTPDADPMASFLPFCAHCERQIVVPNTSILYCSEHCRKQDNKRPSVNIASTSCPSFNDWTTPPLTPHHTGPLAHQHPGYFDGLPPTKNYVTPSSPTPSMASPTPALSTVIVPPVSDMGTRSTTMQRSFSSGSYSPIDSAPPSPTSVYSNIYSPSRGRPNHFRSFTGGSGGVPIATYTRPLPLLHKPHSTYSSSPRSIDLVTPLSPTPETSSPVTNNQNGSTSPTCAELLYEKSWAIPMSTHNTTTSTSSPLAGAGGIKTMFAFDQIRRTPSTMAAPNSGLAKVTAVGSGMGGYAPGVAGYNMHGMIGRSSSLSQRGDKRNSQHGTRV